MGSAGRILVHSHCGSNQYLALNKMSSWWDTMRFAVVPSHWRPRGGTEKWFEQKLIFADSFSDSWVRRRRGDVVTVSHGFTSMATSHHIFHRLTSAAFEHLIVHSLSGKQLGPNKLPS